MKEHVLATAAAVFMALGLAQTVAGMPEKSEGKQQQQIQRRKSNPNGYLDDVGTAIYIQKDLEGATPKLQQQISSGFALFDPRPPERFAYFRYLTDRIGGLRYKGWCGRILSVSPSPLGWYATLEMRPMLILPDGQQPCVLDAHIETYEVSPNKLRYIRGEGQPGALRFLIYP
jgi:hypothetical protein